MHAERLLWSMRVPSLVLIAQAVFEQTDRLNALPTPAAMPAWVIIKWLYCVECPQHSIRLEALG